MSLLDYRIRQDLDDLISRHEISEAVALNKSCALKSPVSTKGLPGYFTGDRNAKTVMVMLNPGCDAQVADHEYMCQLCKLGIDDKHGLNSFVDTYCKAITNYGHIDSWRYDPFDIKQALFLNPWKLCGVTFSNHFPSDEGTYLNAKEAVLTQKLQLELVPYCSRTFEINNTQPLNPYVEVLFDEIISSSRKYVIFCSGVFEKLFKAYNKKYKGAIKGLSGAPTTTKLTRAGGNTTKQQYKCRKINITYKGNSFDAMIAYSFPMQGLGGDLMEKYGEFCHRNY